MTVKQSPRRQPALQVNVVIRSPVPEKNVTFPCYPFPPLPHPTPHTPHFIPTSAPFLPTNPPPIPQFRHALEDDAQTCYPRQREGQTLRPTNPAPNRASLRHPCRRPLWVPCGSEDPAPSPCPPLSRGATLVSQIARAGVTESSRTGDNLSYEAHRMSQKLTNFAFPLSMPYRCGGAKQSETGSRLYCRLTGGGGLPTISYAKSKTAANAELALPIPRRRPGARI